MSTDGYCSSFLLTDNPLKSGECVNRQVLFFDHINLDPVNKVAHQHGFGSVTLLGW